MDCLSKAEVGTFVAPFSDILILARFRVLMKVQNFNLARITGVAHKTVLHFFPANRAAPSASVFELCNI